MREARIVLLRRIAISGLVLLSLGLARLQLVHGASYRQLADRNRLRVIPETAPRGLILDRRGEVVAANTFSFQLAVVPQELPKAATGGQTALFERLGQLVGKPAGELARTFAQQRGAPFLPATVVSRLPKAVALQVEEERWKLPAVLVNTLASRTTPFGVATAHLIGYVGQPTAELFPMLKPYGVRPTDMVGLTGLEGKLDASLRGRSGGSLIEVDHRARQVRVVGYREPIPGHAVTLTIDAKLHALILHAFGEQAGAAVVLDPRTGAVLAMVSTPSFDPELFATQQNAGIHAVLDDAHSPLLNRATLGAYPPGSTAKLITALTALAEGVITPQTTIHCPGFLTIGDRRFHCWNRDGHGPMALHEALRESCNVYFMQVGRRVGLARLRAGLAAVGFNQRTGWVLEETAGHLPGGRRFSEGEVALLAIGQGEIVVTPLQAALMVSAFANGGWLVRPWVVQQVGQDHPMVSSRRAALGWSPAHMEAVRRGMIEVVNDPRGTGLYARSDRVVIAGKTGTAQTHVPGQTHAWFIGFCPAEAPVAAMAVLAEFGGSGGGLPAAIAKQICEYVTG